MRRCKLYREPDHDSWLLAEDHNPEDDMAEPLSFVDRMELMAGRVVNNPRLTVENMKDFQADALELASLVLQPATEEEALGGDEASTEKAKQMGMAGFSSPFPDAVLGGEPEDDPNESVPTPLIPEMGEPVG